MADISPKIEQIPTKDLYLDPENPRFSGRHQTGSQREIAKFLWDEMFLQELIISIGVNGYYKQEPLLITKEGGKWIVVEGNRRLASVKIILDPSLAKFVGAKELIKIPESRLKDLKNLPVIKYNSRKDLWTYLSFRHVNGPRGWSAISKAEFIAHLHLNMEIPFENILRSTGDQHRTSVKMYNGLMVLRQGEAQTKFSREDVDSAKFKFSHLYTLIQYPETKTFLGIEGLDPSKPFPANPIPSTKKKELEDVLVWVFGSKSRKIPSLISSQNPDVSMLDDIISNPEALNYLRETGSLTEAHEYTKKEDRRLETFVLKAEMNIRKAKSLEDAYKGDDLIFKKVSNIHEISGDMKKKMVKKNK
jgi:hypothetical protein